LPAAALFRHATTVAWCTSRPAQHSTIASILASLTGAIAYAAG
jgi:hypothetical protein